jgi:hypothetical protein
MKVTLGKKVYIVHFHHVVTDANSRKKKRFTTFCWISEPDKKVVITKGVSKLNPIDKLNRNLGKARAFQKAIKKYSRDERIIFWLEFHKNFKIRKENK